MSLQDYINEKYDNKAEWFVEEVSTIANQQRVKKVMDIQDYLSGEHKINQRTEYKYNGKTFYPRKIVLQYAKTIVNFGTSYLLQNTVTITGKEEVVKEFQRVKHKGKYNRLNFRLLSHVIKYGSVAEYVYMTNGVIKSKLIPASEGYPVYNDENEYVAFIQAFMLDGVDYYTVYTDEHVEKYNNKGGSLRLIGKYNNLSGLPIVYHNENERYENEGRSEIEDYISILDALEDLMSKYTDSLYKFIDPVFVTVGQTLKDQSLPSEIVGKGINLDDGADAKFLANQMDYKSFDSIYDKLMQSLLDVSSTPAVSMNKTDISNLSEVSIKMLYTMATIKAGMNEQYMREGFEQRFDKIRELLDYQGIKFNDDEYDSLNVVFRYAMPANESELIENLQTLREIGGISIESMLDRSPYTDDVQSELDRLNSESSKDESVSVEE